MKITLGNFAIAKYNSTIDLLMNSGVILESEGSQAAFLRRDVIQKRAIFHYSKVKNRAPLI